MLPTGAGKSLCFQLPAMLLEGATLVIYPILALMADQERRLRSLAGGGRPVILRGGRPVILRGGQSPEEREALWGQIRRGESRLILANPEVLLSPRVMERLPGLGIVHLVIDEAHCVSEWGESFRPGYLRIAEIIAAAAGGRPGGLPLVTAFTATASASVLEKIDRYIFGAGSGGTGAHRIIGNPGRANIRYAAQGCILRDLAVRDLLKTHARPAIVFCASRKGTEQLARYLRNELGDREIRFYHAGLSRDEKTAVEAWFFESPGGVLVSTCAYGMGVDKADIRSVIHRDCPPSVEAYLQESGRAGRDGKASQAILLWGPDDQTALSCSRTGRARSEENRQRFERLLAYAQDTGRCRREALLRLLDYDSSGDCPGTACCDVCEGASRPQVREEASLLDFFRRNRRRYSLKEAVSVLAPPHNAPGWTPEEARTALRYLITSGRLRLCRNPLWRGKISIGKR
ncbi:MAG: RecQ family ATP-dependent DNA helicase [Treponema sp.]|nr:RecQ family ATP-dependent DNA helicase [Treponema sp.]